MEELSGGAEIIRETMDDCFYLFLKFLIRIKTEAIKTIR